MLDDRALNEIGNRAREGEASPEETERLIGEVRRLRALMSDYGKLGKALAGVSAENAAMREARGLAATDAPALAARVRQLEHSDRELDAAHRRQFERARELENARAEALKLIVTAGYRSSNVLKAEAALRSVPDCGACRDDTVALAQKMGWPRDAGCTSCGRGEQSRGATR